MSVICYSLGLDSEETRAPSSLGLPSESIQEPSILGLHSEGSWAPKRGRCVIRWFFHAQKGRWQSLGLSYMVECGT